MGNIHTSGEDYLETILVLWNKQNGEVRSIDVARELNVTKPSVSNAMKILREGKFITMDENGFITLPTPADMLRKRSTKSTLY